MSSRTRYLILVGTLLSAFATGAFAQQPERPFGTLREQAVMQQAWLKKRLDTVLPALMRKHGIDMWVVPMREYNEDPVFSSITSPETFFARRRTIYVFFDKCAAAGTPVSAACVERIALGGTTQGGVFEARSSMKAVPSAVGGRQAELWGDEQWMLLKQVIEERKPKVIGIDRSTTFAFSDGLSSGELQGMSEALGPAWTSKFRDAERLPLELVASRLPEEEAFFEKMTALVWQMTQTMFSEKVITPGKTRTSDLVWWWRQRTNDQGLGTWFQPSIEVQRKGVKGDQLGEDPIIQPGDVLHCDVGITVARLNTDTQHNAYVLRPGEIRRTTRIEKGAAERQRDAGHRDGRNAAGPNGQRDSRRGDRAYKGKGHYRHDVLAPDRFERSWRRAADRSVGLSGRRVWQRGREGDSVDVVFDRVAGDDARS